MSDVTYDALKKRIAELEAIVAYLAGMNTDHIRVALVGNPIAADAIVARARAALEGKKDERSCDATAPVSQRGIWKTPLRADE